MSYQKRLIKAIPGGAHTYSRGHDQFPGNAPEILKRGEGAYVFDAKDQKFLDYGMGLLSVTVGYANPEVNQAAMDQIAFGNNLTRPSLIELEAAELFIDVIDSVDMVKFTKNGSTATTAAVKLSRAFTGRQLIVRCQDHPFFSYDDWFIGSTVLKKGIPEYIIEKTKYFQYNNLESLTDLFAQYPDQIACVIMEPTTGEAPKDDFLNKVQDVCTKEGAIFILDEMKTGFRFHKKGAQHYYNIKPDLSCFGKAMANGFSVAAVGGRRDIMDQGSIEEEGAERLFLLSTTHGAEMSGLGAFVKTMELYDRDNVVEKIWDYGKKMQELGNSVAKEFGIEKFFQFTGYPCSPNYVTLGKDMQNCYKLRTIFTQEMMEEKIMIPWVALSTAHGEAELAQTEKGFRRALEVYAKALEEGPENYLKGKEQKAVFRKFN